MSVTDIREQLARKIDIPKLERATRLERTPLKAARLVSNVQIAVDKTCLSMQRGRETAHLARPLLAQRKSLILNTQHARGQARCNAMLDELALEVERCQREYLATIEELGLQCEEQPAVAS